MDSILQVKNLTKKFKQFTAVNQVSFKIQTGEIFGLLGPNGAGKTTLIRMLTGILKPNSGQIFLDNINVQTNPTEAQQLMGIVPEMTNAYIDLSALDNLTLMGQLYGLNRAKRLKKATELLSLFKLSSRKNSKLKTFSKGMKQRIIIAMALMNPSKILFLDEPTSGLDVKSSHLIRNIIRQLNQAGQTILLTTHNLREANLLCDRVAIINHGQILVIDQPEKLKKRIVVTQAVEVAFNQPIQTKQLKFPSVSKIEKKGDKYQLSTQQIQTTLQSLLKLATKINNQIISIKTVEPSLEEVFIDLTSNQKPKLHL